MADLYVCSHGQTKPCGECAAAYSPTQPAEDERVKEVANKIVKAWLWHTPEHDQERARINIVQIITSELSLLPVQPAQSEQVRGNVPLKDAIKAIASPKAEIIAKQVRELGLSSLGAEGAVRVQFFIENHLLDFAEAIHCLRLLYESPQPAASTPTEDNHARKLTLPELNHLSALLNADRESGSYTGQREQYYARTERLMKWCGEQVKQTTKKGQGK